ncbi:MAG: hypothetical protein AAFU73_01885 [Planctomycetota bacterium]
MRYLAGLLVLVPLALFALWALDSGDGDVASGPDLSRSDVGVDPDVALSPGGSLDGAAADPVDAGRDAVPERREGVSAAEERPPIREVERFPGRIVLEVFDAATRRPLTGVWVQEWTPPARQRGDLLLPRTRFGTPINTDVDSPVAFQWPERGDGRVRRALVFVDGYAPQTVDVHVLRGGRHEVPMERACALQVTLGGARARKARVGLIDAATGEPLYSKTVPTTEPTTVDGLAPGRVLVTAEVVGRGSFATQEAVLSATVPNEVSLFLSNGEEAAPLRIVLEVPVDAALGDSVMLEYRVDALERDESAATTVELDPAEARRFGSHERYTFVTDEVGFGVGEAWIEDLFVDAYFVHSAERPATVVLRVPEPYEFEFVTVDAATGKRTPHTLGSVGFGVHDTVRGSTELTAIEPGRFLATAIAGRVYVGVPSAHGYLETNVAVDARAGGVVEVRLEPIPSILVGMVSSRPGQGNVPWPRDVEPELRRENAPDAEWRYEFEGGGVRLWVDRQSFWTLELPDLPGFRAGQTADVWFGEDTELERQPVGLEAE